MRRRPAIVLLNLLGSLVLALMPGWPGQAPVAVTHAQMAPAGFADFSYQFNGVDTPTGEKPQSKLWYHDGRWWADMFNKTTGTHRIYRLNPLDQTWIDTGTELDARPATKSDCLWDGTHLYVASGGSNLDGVLYRYSYNPTTRTYSRDFGPVTIRTGGAETIVIDKDTTGKFWITYTQNNKVWINRSTTADNLWNPAAAFNPPPADAVNLDPDDISSLVAFDGRVGVLWSNQLTRTFYFAYHTDGAPDTSWVGGIAARDPNPSTPLADDHINLKSLQSDSAGNVFAVVKTSINGTTTASPQLLLLVRKQNGGWSSTVVSTGAENQTRPILLIDTEHRQLYVFTSNESGGFVYYKQSSIDTIQFPSGYGTLFIGSSTYHTVNNATSTKQHVNGTTGIVVLASDDVQKWYLHNYLDLGQYSQRAVFATQPGGAGVGVSLAAQPVVHIQDAPGHTNTNYNGQVTLSIASGTGAGGAALGGQVMVRAVNGVASFSGLSVNTAGTGYRLTASASNVNSAVSDSFDIARSSQTITFGAPPARAYGDPPFTPEASASSGLPISFSATGSCSAAGSIVTITGVGTCTVTANQPGDANYLPATNVTRSFGIGKADQTITFGAPPARHAGDPPFTLEASASSGLPVSFSATGACTLAGTTLTLAGAGTCAVTASQPGDTNYRAAPDVTRSFSITTGFSLYLPMIVSG